MNILTRPKRWSISIISSIMSISYGYALPTPQQHHLNAHNFEHTVTIIQQQPEIIDAADHTLDEKEFSCLAYTTYVEAGGTSMNEKTLVADVIINRTKTHLWGNNICETIEALHPQIGKPGKAFPWISHKKQHVPNETAAWDDTINAAKIALTEPDKSHGATFFAQKNIHTEWTTKANYIPTPHTRHHYYRPPLPIDNTEQVAEYDDQPRKYAKLKNSPYTTPYTNQ